MTRGLLFVFVVSWCAVAQDPSIAFGAQKPGGELFQRPYVYLIHGDDKFGNYAPDYSHTIPTVDSMISVEMHPLETRKSDTATVSAQFLSIRLQRPVMLRVIFADSTGLGLVAYEFEQVPEGEYSLGAERWPKHLGEKIAGQTAIIVYIAADRKLQKRFRFNIDAQQRLISGKDTTLPGK